MFEKRFGLKQRPFPATPDSQHYYPATAHETALERLLRGVKDDEGPMLVTGPPGTGKTLMCHLLLERLGAQVVSAYLTNSHCRDRSALFQAILYELSLAHDAAGEQDLRLRVTDLILKNHQAGKRFVLVIDEAQHLSTDLLEELRLLGNLEASNGKALQVVLVALPRILDTLRKPELAALNQRLSLKLKLEGLDVEEAADYLLHHLRRAGGRPDRLITDDAVELLARHTRGIPRLLNQAGHQAFVLADMGECATVDAEAALESLASLGIEVREGYEDDELLAAHEELNGHDELNGFNGTNGGVKKSDDEDDDDHHRLFPSPRRPA